jgi:hypothetical protein
MNILKKSTIYKITKGEQTLTLQIRELPKDDVDIFAFSPLDIREPLDSSKFGRAICFVPFCENADQLRLSSKLIRAFCPDKFTLIDVNVTYPLHKKRKLSHREIMKTEDVVLDYLQQEGFTVEEINGD